MFRRLDNGPRQEITFDFDGQEFRAYAGENLAAALLAAGVKSFRATSVSNSERAPFCMMGACFDCLVEIDGVNVQACMEQVSAGMQVSRPAIVMDLPDD
jgi:predicted molibdopterin-dependent oxidoreductase YjgC